MYKPINYYQDQEIDSIHQPPKFPHAPFSLDIM